MLTISQKKKSKVLSKPFSNNMDKEVLQMSKFRKLMMLFAISAGAELPREVIREVIYG